MSETVTFLFRFMLFIAVHSFLAVPGIKKLLAMENSHIQRFYRLYYNVGSLLLFGWVMAAYGNSAVLYVAPGVWSLVLYFFQMVLLVTLALCVRQTGMADFLGIPGKNKAPMIPPKLIISGCYGIVRHPLYLFSILFLLCNPIVSVRSLLFTLISSLYFYIGARVEEQRLTSEFGEEYLAYQRAVPFILPRFNK